MPTPPRNSAARLTSAYADLVVGDAPYPTPGPDEIVVRNRAIAVNPLDSIKQTTGDLMYRWLPYPAILGEDVAGECVEVGADVTRFRVGDRVLGYAVGMEKGRAHEAEGAFQEYTVLRAILASPLPARLTFAEGGVLPLAVSTAASALFQQDQLALRHPVGPADEHGGSRAQQARETDEAARTNATKTRDADARAADARETVVVWGASTSVGSNAVQLATAAGYDVVATASPHNHAAVRALGATRVFDYRSPTVTADVVRAVAGSRVAGLLAVGTGSAEACVAIAAATGAKRVSLATPSVSFDGLPRRRGLSPVFVRTIARLVWSNVALQARCARHGIRARFVWGSSLMSTEVGPMLWERFLPAALAEERYVAAPAPEVVGTGLAEVQTALDRLRAGVSARKLVVELG